MSKLTQKQVQDILERHSDGTSVAVLAREHFVTKMVIYYHIKTKGVKHVEKPKCLRDWRKNEIIRLQNKMKENPHLSKHIRGEITRMRIAMGIRLEKCSDDPFVLQ